MHSCDDQVWGEDQANKGVKCDCPTGCHIAESQSVLPVPLPKHTSLYTTTTSKELSKEEITTEIQQPVSLCGKTYHIDVNASEEFFCSTIRRVLPDDDDIYSIASDSLDERGDEDRYSTASEGVSSCETDTEVTSVSLSQEQVQITAHMIAPRCEAKGRKVNTYW